MSRPKFKKKDGSPDTDRLDRFNVIREKLAKLNGTAVNCPVLGRKVIINEDSIEEIAYHASRGIKSTKAALDVVHQIRIAKNPRFHIPKHGNQRQRFRFEMTITMEGYYQGSTTKVTVGIQALGDVIQYCLTVPEEKEK